MLDVDRIESIRPLAELAGHRARALLLDHRADFFPPSERNTFATRSREQRHSNSRRDPRTPAPRRPRTCRPSADRRRRRGGGRAVEQRHGEIHLLPRGIERRVVDLRLRPADAGNALNQHARQQARIRSEQHARRQLLGLLEVSLERLGQRIAGDGHHALVAGRAVSGLDGDDDLTFSGERAKTRPRRPLPTGQPDRGAPCPSTRKSCVHCATSRLTSPLPCNCSVSVPSNLERGGQQQHRAHRLTQQLLHRGRIVLMLAQAPARHSTVARRGRGSDAVRGRIDERDPDHSLRKRAHSIKPRLLAGAHFSQLSFFFNSSLSCAGLALPPVAFMTWPTKKPNSLSLPER